MDDVQGWFWYQGRRGGDSPLCSMGGLDKAKRVNKIKQVTSGEGQLFGTEE